MNFQGQAMFSALRPLPSASKECRYAGSILKLAGTFLTS